MRIGIDLRSLEDGAQYRGIGRYASDLIETLSNIDTQNDYFLLFSNKNAKINKLNLNKKFKYSYLYGKKSILRNIKYIRIIFIMPKKLRVDKFNLDVILQIDTLEELVTKRTPVVSLIYDLIPFIYKEHYQYVHLGGYTPGHIIGYSRMKLRWVILEHRLKLYKSSNKIISISNSSKNDLIEMVPGVKPSDIKVIPLSSGNFSQGKKSINIPELSTRRFIFYVGGADPRKGLVEFAKSLEKLWLNHPELYVVFAGKEITLTDVPEARKLNEVVSQLSKSNQVYLKGFVSDEELSWLYKNATAFVFPSRYEGFGLPVLEAMQAGCPVVAYNNSSIPEVAGNAAILVEDGKSMVPAIEKILDDSKYRNELIQLGKNQAAKFSWEKTARETLEVLVEAVNEG